MRTLSLLLLLTASCSGSPAAPTDSCEPALPTLAVCSSDLTDADLDLSARVWGAYLSCEEGAISVTVAPLDGLVGEAHAPSRTIVLDPSAWDQSAGVGTVLAHEIGHVLGYDHDPDPCALMSPTTPSAACGTVAIDGCAWVL